MSPMSHIKMKTTLKPSAELRRKFSIICGEKTTTQQAILTEPVTPLIVGKSRVIELEDVISSTSASVLRGSKYYELSPVRLDFHEKDFSVGMKSCIDSSPLKQLGKATTRIYS